MPLNAEVHIRASWVLAVVVLAVLVTVACSSADPGSQPADGDAGPEATPTIEILERYVLQQSLDFTITLTTTSVGGTFGRLEKEHTCERDDTSPNLVWEGIPDAVQSLALVVEDPLSDIHGLSIDVLWTHWVVYSIPPEATELERGQAAGDEGYLALSHLERRAR